MKLTVFFPNTDLNIPVTGGQVYDFRFIDFLRGAGGEIDVITDEMSGVKKHKSLWGFSFGLIRKIKMLARNKVLIFNTTMFPYYILPFFFLKIFYPRLKIYGIHHHFRYQEQTGWRRIIYKTLEWINIRQCTKVICPCPYTRDILLKYWPKARVKMLENAFELNDKSVSKYDRYHFLFVGTVYKRKGLTYLIEALSLMDAKERKGIKLDIIGKTTDSEYLELLKEKIAYAGLENIVTIHGRISSKELDDYYSRAYAFILPSLLEGFGLVIVEAMTYGLPVIAFDNSAMPYTIKHGENGLLAKNLDAESLKSHILSIKQDSSLHEKLSAGALNTAASARSVKQLKKETVAFYNNELTK